MNKSILILAVMLAGCADRPAEEEAEEAEYAPIGPGSDSSALIPPDTPESRRGESPAAPPRDTTPRP